MLLVCSKLIPGGKGLASALIKRASTVLLDWDVRQKVASRLATRLVEVLVFFSAVAQ